MGQYKLIAFDGDGTLLNNKMKIPKVNIEAIKYAQDKGVVAALCSGRSLASLKVFAQEIGLGANDYIIGFNGGTIYRALENEPFYKVMLPLERSKYLIHEINSVRNSDKTVKEETAFIIYNDVYSILVEETSARGKKAAESYQKAAMVSVEYAEDLAAALTDDVYKILLVGVKRSLAVIEDYLLSLKMPDVDVMYSSEHLQEIIHKDAQKGVAVKFLADKLNIPMSDVVAIGDQSNDLSMLAAAGMGIAMANGTEEARRIANRITQKDNNEGGVAEAIYRFIQ